MVFGKRFSIGSSAKTGSFPNGNEGQNSLGIGPSSGANQQQAPPPSYTVTDPASEPTIDEINASFNNLRIDAMPKNFPDNDLAMAHLKLLEAFFTLKEDVGYTDGVFDLWDSRAPEDKEPDANDPGAKNARNEALSKIREKRWALFVVRAVDRFETWWTNVLCRNENSEMLTQAAMRSPAFGAFPTSGKVQVWTANMLPPLGW
jgi:hypothetical protein